MSWEKITLEIPDESLKEAVVGEFSGDRIMGVWERPVDGGTELVIYFEDGDLPPLLEARVGRIFQRNGARVPAVSRGVEEEADWTSEWRKGFTSFPVGTRFQVVPSWEEPSMVSPSGTDLPRIVLGLDPGLAFGTGTHETTQTTLEFLETIVPAEGPILDIGAGSGILSIAARKLGWVPVIGCEIDADAVRVASANLDRNSTEVALFLGSVDAVRSGCVRLVLANLTLDVLVQVLPDVARVLGPGGRAVLSGVLVSKADRLRQVLAQTSYIIEAETIRGEWITILVRRNGD